jgi:hypothetical protein
MQVKIFKSTSQSKIEEEVNVWLAALDEDETVRWTDTAVAEHPSPTAGSSQTVIVVSIWYEQAED